MGVARLGTSAWRARALLFALLAWLTLGEWQVFDRLLFAPGENCEFVLQTVQGVMEGTPAYRGWQQRLLGPAAVVLLEYAGLSRLAALRAFFGLCLLLANLLLWSIVRARGGSYAQAGAALISFGCARFLLAYKLEYPWDGIQVLLFLAFGRWAAEAARFRALLPLLVVGAFNHEMVLFMPLWLLLAGPRRARVQGALCALVIGALVAGLRVALYRGPPAEQVIGAAAPVIGNRVYLAHNLRQLFVSDWLHGRIFVAVSFFGALAACAALWSRRRARVAALWSLYVLAVVLCIGYVNETRLYLPLLAFWFSYAWPARSGGEGIDRPATPA